MLLNLALAAALVSVNETQATNKAVLQMRVDRIMAVNGRPQSVQMIITAGGDVAADPTNHVISVPAAVIAMARSDEELDGLFAVLASISVAPSSRYKAGGRNIIDLAALAGLVALTGGAPDPSGSSSQRVIPTGTSGGGAGSELADFQDAAMRGMRWASASGACEYRVLSFFRWLSVDHQIAKGQNRVAWVRSLFISKVLRTLGMSAFPGTQC